MMKMWWGRKEETQWNFPYWEFNTITWSQSSNGLHCLNALPHLDLVAHNHHCLDDESYQPPWQTPVDDNPINSQPNPMISKSGRQGKGHIGQRQGSQGPGVESNEINSRRKEHGKELNVTHIGAANEDGPTGGQGEGSKEHFRVLFSLLEYFFQ